MAILSAGLVAAPLSIQEASAQDTDFNFKQDQENKCSGSSTCSNTATATIIFDPGSDNPGPP